MPADVVVDVDFRAARRARLSPLERLAEHAEEIERLKRVIDSETEMWRQRALELGRTLALERAVAFPFTDDEVLAALREVFWGEPVSAKAIAEKLFRRQPTHSVVVRVGLALSRLQAAGRAYGVIPPNRGSGSRWVPNEPPAAAKGGCDDA